MDEPYIIAIKDRSRLALVEQLCFLQAVSSPVLFGQMTVEASRGVVLNWLEKQRAQCEQLVGAHFQEPGMTALYSEEIGLAIDRMKEIVERIAATLKKEGL
jgi:hypothetical protein